jgi:cytochrome b subunit of formate dehydrogenase
MRSPIGLAILGFALWGAAGVGRGETAEGTCSACHDRGKKLAVSAHAALTCVSCHARHEDFPHPAGVAKPACSQCHAEIAAQHARSVHGQALKNGNAAAPDCAVCHSSAHEVQRTSSAEFHKAVPDLCGMCHGDVAGQFRSGIHGQAVARGISAAPVCTTCHGEHSILAPGNRASSVNAAHIRDTCGQCHANVQLSRRFGLPSDRIVSFDASFHGLAARSGSQSVANCATCHGFHRILPSSDPRSSTNVRNLPATCGRCHPGAGKRFAIGPVHEGVGAGEPEAVKWVRLAYAVLIPLTIGFMLLHQLGDWVRKLLALRFRPVRRAAASPVARREVRMYGVERIEHALTALSFLALVWTGFALKYPDQWWARPLVAWERYFPVRGTVHRIAAVVLMATAALHVATLAANRRLRRHWKDLWPRRQDAPEALLNFAYNLGLVSKKPPLSSHSYIEKAEYWAVVWGTAVMGLTGLLLWANSWALRWLPKSVIDVATAMHLYEAALAALAILVWHLYSVIFDPDVYPLETAFLDGVSVRQRPETHTEQKEPDE